MKIGITGADGFIGFHLRARLHALKQHESVHATRAQFASPQALKEFVRDLDWLVHLAGMNRGSDSEVEGVNVRLAQDLVTALERTRSRPSLVFSNSMHMDRDTAYGRGKRAAAEIFSKWAADSGAKFINLVLPHVFGEFGKPNYNSVVATFCHQLANNLDAQIQVDGQLELIHAQDAAIHCLDVLTRPETGQIRVSGKLIKVSELLRRLLSLKKQYLAQIVPDLGDALDLRLFNTLRSYLYPDYYPVPIALRSDSRGALFEAVKTHQGGQTFLSSTYPGITRGNHFHMRKVERFLVVAGEAEIKLRKLFSNEVKSFRVHGAHPCYIDMPTFHAHAITNVGKSDVTTMFWANEIFDPNDSDTFPEAVQP